MNFKTKLVDLYYYLLDLLPDELALKITGWRRLGYWLNLKKPKTFNEKINWRKLHQRDPRFDVLSDKQDVKTYITEKAGAQYAVPTQWCGADFREIPWDELSYPLVIKSTHSTGDAFFVKKHEELDAEKVYQHLMKFWDNKKLKRYSRSTHESKNKRFIIEPMLGTDKHVPKDYKFYCYQGRVHYVHCDSGRFSKMVRRFYDREWKALDIEKSCIVGPIEERPQEYDEMRRLAETLSNGFDFVRVDLYLIDGHVYCGELTFTPGAGYSRFTQRKWDDLFGEPWKIHKKDI